MIGAILSLLSNAVGPITNLIDELHTSEDEKNQIKQAMFRMQSDLSVKVLEHEQAILKAKSEIITAEAQGASWLQRSWRPITMLTFLVLVVLDTLGLTEFRLSDQAWTLLQIGLGGYVVGRSAEKIVPRVTQVMGSRGAGGVE